MGPSEAFRDRAVTGDPNGPPGRSWLEQKNRAWLQVKKGRKKCFHEAAPVRCPVKERSKDAQLLQPLPAWGFFLISMEHEEEIALPGSWRVQRQHSKGVWAKISSCLPCCCRKKAAKGLWKGQTSLSQYGPMMLLFNYNHCDSCPISPTPTQLVSIWPTHHCYPSCGTTLLSCAPPPQALLLSPKTEPSDSVFPIHL